MNDEPVLAGKVAIVTGGGGGFGESYSRCRPRRCCPSSTSKKQIP